MFPIRDALYLAGDNETTFMYDNAVPSLPLPSLDSSVERVLDSIRPLCDDELQFQSVREKADKFLKDHRVVQAQAHLERLAAENKNWLETFWLEHAYLRSRKPVMPFSNMSAPMPPFRKWPAINPPPTSDAQRPPVKPEPCDNTNWQTADQLESTCAHRSAMSIYFQLCFYKLVMFEKLRPMLHKGVPLTMNQVKYLLTTVRIPGADIDSVQCNFETSPTGHLKRRPASHFLAIHRGYIYSVDALIVRRVSKDDGADESVPQRYEVVVRPVPQIVEQLEHIYRTCRNKPLGAGVGALTTLERGEWARTRDYLRKLSAKNSELCEKIQSAISVLVLDDAMPTTSNEIWRNTMLGDPGNRWDDKSVEVVCFKNGLFGAAVEHSSFDGFCSATLVNYMVMSIRECRGEWKDELNDEHWFTLKDDELKSNVPEPELLEFDLDEKLLKSISAAKSAFVELGHSIELIHFEFRSFGKEKIKTFNVHPEALIQCAIHLAYFRQHRKMASTYVTASTRRFYNGRTETCRSCFGEMLNFVKSMDDKQNEPTKYQLLIKAIQKFNYCMNEASSGRGCDRHLLVLYLTTMQLFKDAQVELFEDRLFQQSNYFQISSSCAGFWNFCGGVPPLVDDGYGCFYGIDENLITFALLAYKNPDTDLSQFRDNLVTSLHDIEALADWALATKSKL